MNQRTRVNPKKQNHIGVSIVSIIILLAMVFSFTPVSSFASSPTQYITITIQLGDVNFDGTINVSDVNAVNLHLQNGPPLTLKQLAAADVNQDGIVDDLDVELLYLIARKLAPTPPVITIILGEVTGDSVINVSDATLTLQFVTGQKIPTPRQKFAADVNGDGKVDSKDVDIVYLIARGLATPQTVFILLGDVTGDLRINVSDVNMVEQFLNGNYAFSPQQAAAADVNRDGKINLADRDYIYEIARGLKNSPGIIMVTVYVYL